MLKLSLMDQSLNEKTTQTTTEVLNAVTQSEERSEKSSPQTGRPTKKTPQLVGLLIEAFHDDATIDQACYIAGIDRSTYYEWLKEDDDFSYKMAKAQEYLLVISKRTLRKAVEKGDEKTALEVIKRREKHRYSERVDTDLTTNGKELTPVLVRFLDENNRHSK